MDGHKRSQELTCTMPSPSLLRGTSLEGATSVGGASRADAGKSRKVVAGAGIQLGVTPCQARRQ